MSNHSAASPIAITMGDAAGIGPEVVLKALAAEPALAEVAVVVGDIEHLRSLGAKLGVEAEVADISERRSDACIRVLDLKNLGEPFSHGADSAVTGRAASEYIVRSVSGCLSGEFAAVATAPISKRSLALAGVDFPGHTEFIAHLTNTPRVAMSFFAGKLRVVLLSTHLPLTRAIQQVTKDNLIDLITFSAVQLEAMLGRRIKLAVAGLNPHASENGMFGSEEADEIIPAVDHCRGESIEVTGPYSPDTIFLRCFRGEFDAVIALYHDQATIPVKSIGFGEGVNVTLGLPIIRTSVDHGTAYDIAGKGVADPSSMRSAIRLALELSAQRSS
ncbi:MAG: 4-hydroxythreonine-4-phosphate dehydrogenase PdxA [Acidobacteriota bacterium]|nr:MAG: 4-hydroxythreonine-4-phosphate dehydrogenase PdxA [Acidobacteriota bacterium]